MVTRIGRGFLSGNYISGNITVNGDLTMGSGKVLTVDSGTGATAPSLRFRGSDPGTGFYASSADRVSLARAGTLAFFVDTAGLQSNVPHVFASSLTAQQSAIFQSSFRLSKETTKTSNYTATTTDAILNFLTGATDLLLPDVPGTDQMLWVKNRTGGNLTITAGAGDSIDGAATLVLANGAQALIHFDGGTTWNRLGA